MHAYRALAYRRFEAACVYADVALIIDDAFAEQRPLCHVGNGHAVVVDGDVVYGVGGALGGRFEDHLIYVVVSVAEVEHVYIGHAVQRRANLLEIVELVCRAVDLVLLYLADRGHIRVAGYRVARAEAAAEQVQILI